MQARNVPTFIDQKGQSSLASQPNENATMRGEDKKGHNV
jgi:hypothetical protein